MEQFFSDWGLFMIKLLSAIALIAVTLAAFALIARRGGGQEGHGLRVSRLNEAFERSRAAVERVVLDKAEQKRLAKRRKGEARARDKSGSKRPKVFVLDFKGDMRASAGGSLREEVSAVLAVVGPEDSVLVRLENPGGLVHEHGLAASQLQRLRDRGVSLTVAVDKVAASGGYLMACVANEIIAAPFAIIGSIGVIQQLPNFHRWLESRGIDYEQVTAGKFKRTLTMFGENTDEAREKLRAELDDIHELFKSQIARYRSQVDLDQVATGEHWYGTRALQMGLIDSIQTSDDFLLGKMDDCDLISVCYRRRRSPLEKLTGGAESLLRRF